MHKTSRHFLRTSGFYTQPLVLKYMPPAKSITLHLDFHTFTVLNICHGMDE